MVPPASVPRLCDVPSPKLIVTSRKVLLPVAFATSNVTVAVLLPSLAATDAHVPVPLAGVHLTVTAGAGRSVTVAVPVAAPADAVTFVQTEVVRVLGACPPA